MSEGTNAREGADFELTYATMFNPPEELHTRYETALEKIKAGMGGDVPMLIGGEDVHADEQFADRSPIDQDWLIASFQKGGAEAASEALSAARTAFAEWSATPWQERCTLVRKAADLIQERIYEFGAVLSLDVGKNRMEALADIAEAARLFRYACDQMEAHDGFVLEMGRDPIRGYEAHNLSVLRPYGVWVVIVPFNFPAALAGGPVGAALVAGNTVVLKPATDTPWAARLLAEVVRDAGLPKGALNYVTGPGGTLGEALIGSPEVDGITFTGSYDVGMHIYQEFSKAAYPRRTILEMGGKNPCIVSRHADLDRAAEGIVRSAFGLQGQKCSANTRVYIERPVYDELVEMLVERTEALTVGDPTERDAFMGPVINRSAYDKYKGYMDELKGAGKVLTGGHVLTEGALGNGFFCQPTLVADVPVDHRLWKFEMFVPITLLRAVDSLGEAMELANDVLYGLTAGFYGSEEEADWFFDNIEAGVAYANRPQGSTTGAWPGYQPFGGWKASGATGKNVGGVYYLPQYMREQVWTLIR